MKLSHSNLPALAIIFAATLVAGGGEAIAQTAIPPSISTPDKVESRLRILEFKDGAPSKATLEKVYDHLDFTHAFRAFVDTMQGVSMHAIRKGFLNADVRDNEVIVWSELLDAKTLMLTANADTVYVMAFLDLTKGPMVLEVPPKVLGAIDDHWSRWVTDTGLPGPDRGEGGKYLIVPSGYDGTLPEGGCYVARARTNFAWWFGRMFLENKSDPKPAAEAIRKFTKIYPYEPGGVGTPIAEFLAGKAPLGQVTPPPPTVFHEGSGKVMNTIPPNDWSFYEMLNEIVQQEPATSLDPELMGPQDRQRDGRAPPGQRPVPSCPSSPPPRTPSLKHKAVSQTSVDRALRHHDALDAGHAAALSARRQPELSVARRRTGCRRLHDGYFGPDQPAGVGRGNWIQTMPGKRWFVILRLYSPLEPFFTKEWRPSEIERVT
jgi:hypothetical protein